MSDTDTTGYRSPSQFKIVRFAVSNEDRDSGSWSDSTHAVITIFVANNGINGWEVSADGITVQGEVNDSLQVAILKWLIAREQRK